MLLAFLPCIYPPVTTVEFVLALNRAAVTIDRVAIITLFAVVGDSISAVVELAGVVAFIIVIGIAVVACFTVLTLDDTISTRQNFWHFSGVG